jgi:hypothetical protein
MLLNQKCRKALIMENNRQLSKHITTLFGDVLQDVNSILSVIEQRRCVTYEAYTQFKADRSQLRQFLDRLERQIDVVYLTQGIPPVISPDAECAWCWVKLHPDIPYPAEQSTICSEHTNWVCRQVQALRGVSDGARAGHSM